MDGERLLNQRTRTALEDLPVPEGRSLADLDEFWTVWRPTIADRARDRLGRAGVPRALADVDDALQHSYAELLQRWQTTDFAAKHPGRFVLGAVLPDYVRLQVKELKKRSTRSNESTDETADPALDPESLALDRERSQELAEALSDLPDSQRRAVELTVGQGLPRTDVAAQLGVAVGTVSSHRNRGLRALVEALVRPRVADEQTTRRTALLALLLVLAVPVVWLIWWIVDPSGATDDRLWELPNVFGAVSAILHLLVSLLAAHRWQDPRDRSDGEDVEGVSSSPAERLDDAQQCSRCGQDDSGCECSEAAVDEPSRVGGGEDDAPRHVTSVPPVQQR